ncbi:hypothetical protein C8R44DRAFT_731975 [Mycena epipterygia]|nr:hypothetical protein C8R44DRAFT_731975 [Mycena epipterygia]
MSAVRHTRSTGPAGKLEFSERKSKRNEVWMEGSLSSEDEGEYYGVEDRWNESMDPGGGDALEFGSAGELEAQGQQRGTAPKYGSSGRAWQGHRYPNRNRNRDVPGGNLNSVAHRWEGSKAETDRKEVNGNATCPSGSKTFNVSNRKAGTPRGIKSSTRKWPWKYLREVVVEMTWRRATWNVRSKPSAIAGGA